MASGVGSRRPLVIILAVIGVLAIVLAVLYAAAPTVLPHFMFRHGEPIKGVHSTRAAVSGAFGVLCLIGAWLAARSRRA
jgi:hypothetical protein